MKNLPGRAPSLLAATVALLLLGCAPTGLYNYGDYSNALYQYKKSPTDETLRAYGKSLESVIKSAEKRGKPAPPGIYCEYGSLLAKTGQVELGISYLGKERVAYPESAVFVDRLAASITGTAAPSPSTVPAPVPAPADATAPAPTPVAAEPVPAAPAAPLQEVQP